MKYVAAVLALLWLPALVAQENSPADAVKRDLDELVALLPGRFDNAEQVYFQAELGVPEDEQVPQQHLQVRVLDWPPESGRWIHSRSWLDGASEPSAERYDRFWIDESGLQIWQQRYALDDAGAAPSPDNLSPRGCAMGWRRLGEQFDARPAPGCARPELAETVLSARTLWIASPESLQAQAPYVRHRRLHRAREFVCWAGVARRDPDAGLFFRANLRVHDQGGWIWLETDEEPPQKVGLRMRNVSWPNGRNRHSLVLYAYRDNAQRAESYTWTAPEAERLALNLRWVQASCTADRESETWHEIPTSR